MTKHHNRLARWVFRIGVAVCMLIVVVSALSSWRSFNASGAGWDVRVNYGSVYVLPDSIARRDAWSIGPASQDFHLWMVKWQIFGVTVRSFPTWMFLIAGLLPTYLAWRRLHRKYPPGRCQCCGYDLTGNVTGKCSECGTSIAENDK